LEEDEIVESDSAVTKAGTVVESIPNPEQHMALILRYKSTYARVLDANRKFLQAASRYHDLSQSSVDLIQAEDLLAMLGRAATCAILAPSGPQRQRVLGHVSQESLVLIGFVSQNKIDLWNNSSLGLPWDTPTGCFLSSICPVRL
jgi:COP9 signalosome complex subunit 4